jgi:hypothetical protein
MLRACNNAGFWELNRPPCPQFQPVGIAELSHAIGITAPSLYSAFGNKRQLFEHVLQKYVQFDCQSDGSWHIAEPAEDGNQYAFIGCFHEAAIDERIVQTFEFLGMLERGHVMLEKAAECVCLGRSCRDACGCYASFCRYRYAVDALCLEVSESGARPHRE